MVLYMRDSSICGLYIGIALDVVLYMRDSSRCGLYIGIALDVVYT